MYILTEVLESVSYLNKIRNFMHIKSNTNFCIFRYTIGKKHFFILFFTEKKRIFNNFLRTIY